MTVDASPRRSITPNASPARSAHTAIITTLPHRSLRVRRALLGPTPLMAPPRARRAQLVGLMTSSSKPNVFLALRIEFRSTYWRVCRFGVVFLSLCQCLQTSLGQTSCSPCPVRFEALPGSVICRECRSGYFRNSTAQTNCQPCPPGRFSVQPLDGSGIADCLPCEIGKQAPGFGNTRCDVCPRGRFGNSSAQGECPPCPRRTSNDAYGSLTCSLCASAALEATIICVECPEGTACLTAVRLWASR